MRAPLPSKLLFWALAVLLSACSRPEEKGEELQIRLLLDAAPAVKTSAGAVDEDGVAFWFVLIYDSQGRLLRETLNLTENSFTMTVDALDYADVTMYVFANIDPDRFSKGWADEQTLLANSYGLDIIQQSGKLPMCCRQHTGFTSSRTVNIALERMVSKIRLERFEIVLSGEYADDMFSREGVYLQNVVPSMSLKQYFSRSSDIAAKPGLYPWFYHANWMYSKFDASAYRGNRNETDALRLLGNGNVFYTLPNFSRSMRSEDPDWADLCTKLVVEAYYVMMSIDTQFEMFYPIEAVDYSTGCLEPNNVYNFRVIINGPGYLNPWGPRDNTDPQVSLSLSVTPWSRYKINENI